MPTNQFSAGIKSLLRDGIKAASGLFSGSYSNNSVIGGYGYPNQGGSRLFGYTAGSQINWDLVTGSITDSPIAFTCLSYIADNFVQAPVVVEVKKRGEKKYEPVPDHPLVKLLQNPNPYYDGDYLTKGILSSMHGQSDAYVGIERDGLNNVKELYWLPYGVSPVHKKDSKKLIDGWLYKRGQKTTEVALEDIIHIPFGTDPARPGMGLSGWNSLKQDRYILQQGGNYTANIFRNNGTVGVLLTPKTVKDSNNTPMQPKIDPQTITDLWRAKTRGDKVGDAMYIDYPLDINFPKNSPQELVLDTILDRPECNVCMTFKVPIILIGAYAGRSAKTYNNTELAETAFWEECQIPQQKTLGSAFTRQLLPQMGGDTEIERVGYDNSEIRALQPDLDKLHERVRNDFDSNLIDLYTAKVETKRVAEEKDKDVYAWMLPHIAEQMSPIDKQYGENQQIENGSNLSNNSDNQNVITDKRKQFAIPAALTGAGRNGKESSMQGA